MYQESDLFQLAALQHYLFCPRQCALIHLEQIWMENRYTAEGQLMHERADSERVEMRGDRKIVCSLMIRSLRLGVSGKADVVEFFKKKGKWLPFPVEYKRGRPKKNDSDRVQLCAQAMCLEEMLKVDVPCGALFYGKQKRRLSVDFDDALRTTTEDTACAIHAMLAKGVTPVAKRTKKCETCSLLEVCMPEKTGSKSSASRYLSSILST
ncbi:MAG: CRISPR-associated protein Cas4 [Desulfoplanes sp.]